ncbi:MAG: hypothetical protein INF81_18305 [Roseomonas sp.]|nr:hypothetical protein [Roseomonas sp.]MCA3428703.1 hypothetical protein [Roseomonas sp.]MCA3434615.1 hypothetical protein [Roseomonas sp.]
MTLSVSPQVVALKQLRADLAAAPWSILPLGHPDVAEINPKVDLKSLNDDAPVSFLPMEAVEENTNTFHPTVRPVADVRKGYTAFADNDVIWAKITPCMQNGKSALVRGLTNGVGSGSTEFHVLRAGPKALPEFLWAMLSMPRLLFAAQGAFAGSSGHQRVPASFLEHLLVPVPPESVQAQLVNDLHNAKVASEEAGRRSVGLISSIDDLLVEALSLSRPNPPRSGGYAIRRLTALNGQTLSADYFHPERMHAISQIVSVPNAKLSELVTFERSILKEPGQTRYLGLASVASNTGQLTDAIETATGQCFRFEEGDVLYGRLRPYLNKVWAATFGGVCSTEFHVMRTKDEQRLRPEYLAVVLRTGLIVAQTKHMMTGNTHPRIANEDVGNLLIPLADPEVQDRIVAAAMEREAEASRLRDEAQSIWQAARQRFENQLFNGVMP